MTALLLTYFTALPVMAEDLEIGTIYVDQNFDDAEYGFDIYDDSLAGGSYQPVNVYNYATGKICLEDFNQRLKTINGQACANIKYRHKS